MAQEWHYEKDGERHGPVTPQQLKQLAASGELQPSDLIWKDGMAEWKPAQLLKGLFQATSQRKASEPPPITGQSKPSSTELSPHPADNATDQPGLLKRAKTKFSSLPAPQKVIYGILGGMGVCFFLCMGMCGLAGLFGSFLPDEPEIARSEPATGSAPDSIQGRWYKVEHGGEAATILIIDGKTMKRINPFTGESTVTEYTVNDDTDPKQIDLILGDQESRTTRSSTTGEVLFVLPKTMYGIYQIRESKVESDKGTFFLVIRHEMKGFQHYRPKNFTDNIDVGERYDLILLDGHVEEQMWTWGRPPDRYKTGE